MIEIQDAHLLEALFGHWPDFRNAAVPRVRFLTPRDRPAQLELDIEVAELFTDARGVERDRQRCVTTFRFTNVLGARVEMFRPLRREGGLAALEFAERDRGSPTSADWTERRYRVRLVPSMSFPEAQFLCDEVAVLRAVSISRAI